MRAVQVRNVPDEIVEALKRRARRNRRSLQQELLVVLEVAAAEVPLAQEPPFQLHFSNARPTSDWGRDEIYDGDDGR